MLVYIYIYQVQLLPYQLSREIVTLPIYNYFPTWVYIHVHMETMWPMPWEAASTAAGNTWAPVAAEVKEVSADLGADLADFRPKHASTQLQQ